MSARSRALIPLSAEQQAAMQAVAVTEQRRRQGRTLSAWPYATAFFRCLNGSRRISLTDLRFFAPALTKEEFHGNRLLWLAAVDKLIESFGEVCVLPLPSDAGHRLFPSVPFREGERRRQKTTLTEQKYSRQREREAERRELEYQTCFAQAQIDLAFHTPAIQTRELVMLIKRLASSLKAVKPDSCVVREAQDWLRDRKLVDITDILR